MNLLTFSNFLASAGASEGTRLTRKLRCDAPMRMGKQNYNFMTAICC